MNWRDRIESKPEVLRCKPCVKGTRLSVEHLAGCSPRAGRLEDLLDAHPGLTRDDVLASLKYAPESVASKLLPVEA